VIRDRFLNQPLFYSANDIALPGEQNLYVRLNTVLSGKWKHLAEPLRKAFSETTGRPVDPVVYLKVFLVGFLENIVFDTQLAERIDDSKAIRYFLGFGLSEPTPDHSSISRVRSRVSELGLVQDVLTRTVELCADAGLVFGELTSVDSTLLSANAHLRSLRHVHTGETVREYLGKVKGDGETERPRCKKPRVSNEEFRSKTDGDARVARKGRLPKKLCYKWTQVVKGKVAIASTGTTSDVGDSEAGRLALLEAARNLARSGTKMGVVLGDAGYDDSKFHAQVEGLGGVPLTNLQKDTSGKPEGLKKESFRYDASGGFYVCPNGCELRRMGDGSGRRSQYRSKASDCAGCPLRTACLENGSTRRNITRMADEESRERVFRFANTPAGARKLAKRKGMAERRFGHAKAHGGLSMVNCRGLLKAEAKMVFASVSDNLRVYAEAKLRGHTGAGRHPLAPATLTLNAIRQVLDRLGSGSWGLARRLRSTRTTASANLALAPSTP